MKRQHLIPAAAICVAGALAINAAMTTQPSSESPPTVVTLFSTPPSPAEARLTKTIKQVRLDRVALADALDWLRDEADVNLIVNWEVLATVEIDRKTPVTVALNDVTAAEALHVICTAASDGKSRSMGFLQYGNLVFVNSETDLELRVITRIYDIADLLRLERLRRDAIFPGSDWSTGEIVEAIIRVMQEFIAPELWRENGGTQGAVRELNGRLIITQTPANHRKIAELLDVLRAATLPIPIAPKTQPSTRPAGNTWGTGLFR
ncbi:hypothetical protein [Humisphaera borealis]|uniref:NolW-like domain-containing protein n=1 Tax=Humisphaera borealis TaxID=2807512 RepID=A0A7M2WTU2_9BACT|nr:hypothetical protein [Humisphaera borealis]QOV88869.1 hypothetical protein IPV69_21985 [Humisphaera borealis]